MAVLWYCEYLSHGVFEKPTFSITIVIGLGAYLAKDEFKKSYSAMKAAN